MKIEPSDRLNEAIQLCAIHSERMKFAWSKLSTLFPLNLQRYLLLEPETLSFFDQLIFRFSKLQDSMGEKLFPALLENLGEEVRGKPFIDILTKMEELGLLQSSNEWLLLRETRNIVTHEYPFVTNEIIEGLNLLAQHYKVILAILNQINHLVDIRFSKS
jgi:hypothetical protein